MKKDLPVPTEEKKIPRLIDLIGTPIINILNENDITPTRLAKKLDQGLEAKVTKTLKVKGLVKKEDLPEGYRVVATSGAFMRDKEGNETASDGETIISWDEIDNSEQRENRQDAHRLMGHYPLNLSGDAYIQVFQQNNTIISPVVKELLSRHNREMVFDEAIDVEAKEVEK